MSGEILSDREIRALCAGEDPMLSPFVSTQEGKPCIKLETELPDGARVSDDIPFGEMRVYPLAAGETVAVKVTPTRNFDAGAGPGKPMETRLSGGVVGLMVDTRGRPFRLPASEGDRIARLEAWARAFDAYPN